MHFSCNLQRNSTLKRCKFLTNVWYVENVSANCDGNLYLPILHRPRVELHRKLQVGLKSKSVSPGYILALCCFTHYLKHEQECFMSCKTQITSVLVKWFKRSIYVFIYENQNVC